MNSQNRPLKKWQFKALVATAAFCLIGSAAWSQSATVTVNASSVIAPVPPQGYGVNAALYEPDLISSQLPATFKAAGISSVRYPGGSYSDCFHWQTTSGTPATNPPNYPGCSIYIADSNAGFDNFMNTDVNPAGAHTIITVNYGSNAAGTGGGDPSEAAAWVQHANITNNWNVEYWEIGNEIGGNGYFGNPGWEFDLHYPYNGNRAGAAALSPEAYATNTLAYISAMKAVDSSIKIGVGVWCPDTNNNNPRLFNTLASKLDFLIIHWYPGSSAFSAEQSLASDVANIRNQIAAAGGNRNIPLAITETNADGAFSAPLDAVWNVDNYLTWFELGAVNVDYWEIFGGFLSSPTSPDDPYYAVQFANTVAGVGDNLVTTSSSNSTVRSHAVVRTDGSVGVMLLNENSSNATVSVSISGATVSSSGTKYTLNPSSAVSSSSISGIGNNFSVTVPGSTAIGIVIPAGSVVCNPTPIVPEMNVGGVWTQESSATVASTTAVVDLGPQPLTGGSWAWSGPSGFTSAAREIDTIKLTAGANVYTATYTNTCGAKSTQAFTITVPSSTGSFTIKPSAATLSIAQGASGADTITVTDVSPFTGSVTLAASGLPNGVTAAFATNPTTATSVLTLTASSTATAGASTVTITGTSGSLSATTTIALTVTSSSTGSFTIKPSAAALSIAQGASGTDTITITDVSPFTGSVTLAASGLPSGVTAAFATNPATSTSVLTLTASSTAAAGTSTVTVTGTSGTLSATATIALTVTAVTSGAKCTVDYTITPQNNTAFGATLVLVNNSSTAWTSWTLTWTFANGQTFQSLWNGIETQSGANVTVKNENYNGSVAAGGSVTGVGFNGNWNGTTNSVPTNFAINGTACTVN